MVKFWCWIEITLMKSSRSMNTSLLTFVSFAQLKPWLNWWNVSWLFSDIPSCGHCIKLEPQFEQLNIVLRREKSPVVLAQVNPHLMTVLSNQLELTSGFLRFMVMKIVRLPKLIALLGTLHWSCIRMGKKWQITKVRDCKLHNCPTCLSTFCLQRDTGTRPHVWLVEWWDEAKY